MARVLNIEIRESDIVIAEVESKKLKVYNIFEVPTPKGAVVNNVIEDIESIYSAISEVLVVNKIKTKLVTMLTSSTRVATKEIILPDVNAKKTMMLIDANFDEYFPIDRDSYSVNYTVIEKYVDENDKKKYQKLNIYICPYELVNNYLELSEKLGLKLHSIEYVGNSQYQYFKKISNENIDVFIRFRDNNTLITVLKENKLEMQRVITYGLNDFIRIVNSREELEDNSKYGVLEYLSNNQLVPDNLDLDTFILENNLDEKRFLIFEITDVIKQIKEAIFRVLEIYVSKNRGIKFDNVYLIGEAVQIKGLDKELIRGFEINVVKDIPVLVDIPDTKYPYHSYYDLVYASVSPINFTSRELKTKVLSGVKDIVRIAGLATCVVVAGVLATTTTLKFSKEKNLNKELNVKVTQYDDVKKVYLDYHKALRENTYAIDLDNKTLIKSSRILDLIGILEKVLPTNAEISGFSSTETGIAFSIEGNNVETLAKTLLELQQIDYLQNVKISGVNLIEKEVSNQTLADFERETTYFNLDNLSSIEEIIELGDISLDPIDLNDSISDITNNDSNDNYYDSNTNHISDFNIIKNTIKRYTTSIVAEYKDLPLKEQKEYYKPNF